MGIKLSSKFSIDFQSRMLAVAATQPFFLELYQDVFKPNLFTSQYHRDFCSWIGEFHAKYKNPPNRSSLQKILNDNVPKDNPLRRGYRLLLEQIYSYQVDDYDYIKDQVIVAARYQGFKGALLKMTDQLEAGEFEQLSSTLSSAMKIGSGAGDIGMALTKSVTPVLLKFGLLEQPVKLGFKRLERAIGGCYDGELTVIVAPPNQGKTAYLGNIAFGAARQDQIVMYYTLEIGAERMLSRFYARMSKLKTKELYKNIDRVRRAVKRFQFTTYGNVYVKFFPANSITVETLRSHLAMVKGNDINPALVIVDYADKIRPMNTRDPSPERLRQIYSDLRSLGSEFKVHVMSASQSRRSTLYARLIDLDDLAESWGKAQEADSIACVCQTRNEKEASVARLLLAKTRNETSGKFVFTKNQYETLAIDEISKKDYSKIMKRKGFKLPIDEPKTLRPSKDDEDLQERYDED